MVVSSHLGLQSARSIYEDHRSLKRDTGYRLMNRTTTSDLRRRRRNQADVTKRENLFHRSTTKKPKKKGKDNHNDEAKAKTSSLMRTKEMMKNELQRVSDVSSALQDDEKKLKDTRAEHERMGGGVKDARYALGWLKVKEKEDVIVFWSAVVFFYCVVLYVMWTRIRIPFLLW